MKNIMKKQIRDLFKDHQKTLEDGLWFSGYYHEGKYREWYASGNLFKESFYKNHERNGEDKLWNEDGTLIALRHFKDGKRDGEYKQWDNNGILQLHSWFENNEEVVDFMDHPEYKKRYNIE